MEHSKLPWRVDEEPTDGTPRALVDADNMYIWFEKENCDFIVEACNNYERLQAENKAWETNYNNLLAQHEEISAIAYSKAEEVDRYKQAMENMKARYGA